MNLVCKELKCPRSFRALVVDDNEVTRGILNHYLLAWEIETVAVSSTAEAWNLLRQQADSDRPFYEGKVYSALWYGRNVIPQAENIAKMALIEDESPMQIPDAAFATV